MLKLHKKSFKVFIENKDLTIWTLRDMVDENDLILSPDFQREYVYDDIKASMLVESILLGIPIPEVYLNEESDNIYSVIDGQQRITSLVRFARNDFKLKKLPILIELEGLMYKDLDKSLQRQYKSATIESICIKKESSDIKYEIFSRLNQGSISLNSQELRNCVYRGSFNNLLKELASHPVSNSIFKTKNKRQKYEENILRFFTLRYYSDYKSSMSKTLNKYMAGLQFATQDTIAELRDRYLNTMEAINYILGDDAFSCMINGDKDSKFSISIFDSIAVPFSFYTKEVLIRNSDIIREAINHIKSEDINFYESCVVHTTTRNNIHYRIGVIHKALIEIIGLDGGCGDVRCFDEVLKIELYSKSKVCSICNNEILKIEDAEVDHITPYSLGGKTNLANAQITHRHCNRVKSDKVLCDA